MINKLIRIIKKYFSIRKDIHKNLEESKLFNIFKINQGGILWLKRN